MLYDGALSHMLHDSNSRDIFSQLETFCSPAAPESRKHANAHCVSLHGGPSLCIKEIVPALIASAVLASDEQRRFLLLLILANWNWKSHRVWFVLYRRLLSLKHPHEKTCRNGQGCGACVTLLLWHVCAELGFLKLFPCFPAVLN